MAFSVTARHTGTTGTTGAQTVTTDSTTPTASSLVLVGYGVENNGHGTLPALGAPTGGPSLTLVGRDGDDAAILWNGDSQFVIGGCVYRGDAGASPSSFAFTCDPYTGTDTGFITGLAVDITGHNATTPVVQSAALGVQKGGGNSESGTVTLGAAPTSGNLLVVFVFSGGDATGAPAAPTAGSGKTTTQASASSGPNVPAGVFYRECDGTESATITCADLGQSVGNYVMVAVEIASGGGPSPTPMPVSVVGSGAFTTSGATSPLSIAIPSGAAENDVLYALIITKDVTATITATNWAEDYVSAGLGGGTVGTGTGPVGLHVMKRVVPSGGLSGNVSFTVSSPNSYMGMMVLCRYTSTGYTSPSWAAITGVTYSRTTGSTTFGGTGSADLGLAANDVFGFVSVSSDDQSSSHDNGNDHTLTATGTTLGTLTKVGTGVTTTGGDCSMFVSHRPVTAGPSSAAPVATLTGSSSETGGGIFLRIRATGISMPTGTGSGTWTFAGTGSGQTTKQGTGTGTLAYAGTATGTTVKSGTGSGTWAFAGAGSGSAPTAGPAEGSGSGTFTFTGTAAGATVKSGSGIGTWTTTGAAAGTSAHSGVASGDWATVGTAAGTTAKSGTGTGVWAFLGAAIGSVVKRGTAGGLWEYIGAAVGEAPIPGMQEGSGAGSWSFTGAAAGATAKSGTGTGTWTFAGSAVGDVPGIGTAAGSWAFTGAGVGTAPPVFGDTDTPATRTRLIPADNRIRVVSSESRTRTIPAQPRTRSVPSG